MFTNNQSASKQLAQSGECLQKCFQIVGFGCCCWDLMFLDVIWHIKGKVGFGFLFVCFHLPGDVCHSIQHSSTFSFSLQLLS